MIYLSNNTETQRVYIPRTNIDANAYNPSTGGTERYYAGDYIEITPTNVINVTGLTEAIESTVTGMTLNYATTGDVETMISAATVDFVTSGDVESQITAATQNLVTSGDVETMISGFTTSGDVETMISSATSGMATTQDVENAVSGKADTSAVTESINNAVSGLASTTYVDNSVSGLASTTYVDNSVSGKADTSAVTESINNAVSGLASTTYVDNSVSGKADTSAVTESINNAVSGLASTTYVDNSVSGKADTSAVTEVANSLSAYTPTSGFSTVNGSAITEGGNIVIEAGGGDIIEEITTLPTSPENGAIYNYKGTLIRYVNGAGSWGEWSHLNFGTGYGIAQVPILYFFYYSVIPSEYDGTRLCQLTYIGTSVYAYFNLTGDTIDVYSSDSTAGTLVTSITRNASSETAVRISNSNRFYVSWNDNVIEFRTTSNYEYIPNGNVCPATSSTAHYELVNIPDRVNFPNPSIEAASYLVGFNKNQKVIGPTKKANESTIYFNTSGYSANNIAKFVTISKGSSIGDRWYIPMSSGETGSLCVAQGVNSAPIWKTIAQALGVDFWTGSQDDYDNMPSHSPTTIYFIIPD